MNHVKFLTIDAYIRFSTIGVENRNMVFCLYNLPVRTTMYKAM